MGKIEFADIAIIIVALINLIGIIYSKIKNTKTRENSKKTGPLNLKIIFSVNLFVLAAMLVLFFWHPWKDNNPEIMITNVAETGYVEIDVMVKGISKSIPKDKKIWMVIYSHSVNRFYPQNKPADMQVNGDWSSRCFFGIKEDVGQKFDLIAILADKNTQQLFNEHLEESRNKESWPGLEKIPDNSEIYQRITVVRK